MPDLWSVVRVALPLLVLAWLLVRREGRLRFLFLARVPLVVLAACVLIPAVALLGDVATLEGVYAQRDWIAVALTVATATGCVGAARVAWRLLAVAAPLRFGSLPDPNRKLLEWRSFGLQDASGTLVLTAPTAIAVGWLSQKHESLGAGWVVVGVALGLLAGVGVFALFSRVARRTRESLEESRYLEKIARRLRGLPPAFREGYVEPEGAAGRRVLAGHVFASMGFAFLAAIYQTAIFALEPVGPIGASVPALCYVHLFGIFATSVLTGASFFFDRFRVPLVLVVLGSYASSVVLWDTDHYFQVRPFDGPAPPLVTALDAAQAKVDRAQKKRLVVVCAAGGGIQAAAWTAHAMNELEAATEGQFSAQLACVSGVSGGSVGALYFLEALDRAGGPLSAAQRESVWNAATRSSLTAAMWGWVLKDIPRGIPFLAQGIADRGWALESAWRHALEGSDSATIDSTLVGWSDAARTGGFPAVFMNSTSLATSRRVLFANVRLTGENAHASQAFQAHELYDADVPVVTAARMSATFPYVTPMARPGVRKSGLLGDTATPWLAGDRRRSAHLADGGYFDNLGVMTALRWIEQVGSTVDEIALVTLVAFPEAEDREDTNAVLAALLQDSERRSLTATLAGPALLVAGVRGSSQVERGGFERELREESARPPKVRSFVLRPSSQTDGPLNWHLTTRQRQDVLDDWKAMSVREAEAPTGLTALIEWIRQD